MDISIGAHLGQYEITAMLGKGGMGEVYRARDAKLKRDVAIKILPDEFSRDADRIARFHREAEALAAINHPNIAGVHDLQEAHNSQFLVLELVEGETLAERLQRGALPADEALNFARQICEGLEAAHEKNIIHRDLKPANIKITPDGNVKLLDFGLARIFEDQRNVNLSNSPTMMSGSLQGMILGTAAYMSPEQAKGYPVDARADIFSFGCVLYEMLTGRLAFDGDSVSEILASVLKSDPDLNLLPANLDPRIRQLLLRSLEKKTKLRWYAIGDVRVELETILAGPPAATEDRRPPALRPLWKRAIPVVMGALLSGAIAVGLMLSFRQPARLLIGRFTMTLPEGQMFIAAATQSVAISPDGSQMVYVTSGRLYLRPLAELVARPIPGPQGNLQNPVFSPDSRSIAFWAGSESVLKKIAVSGGGAVTLCAMDAPFGMSWGDDGIVVGQGTKGVIRVSSNGGNPETLVSVKNGETVYGPSLLPGGQALLLTLASEAGVDRWDRAKIVVHFLRSGTQKTIIEEGADARYLPTGHIVYARDGILFAVPFDLSRLEVTGDAVPIVEGVRRANDPRRQPGGAQFSFSQSGSLIYVTGPVNATGAKTNLALIDRKGIATPLKLPPGFYEHARISPNGKQVAFTSDDGKTSIIWVYDLSEERPMRQLTFAGQNRYPIWSSDGQQVAFQSDREGDLAVYWQKADGTGTAQRLTTPEQGAAHFPVSWRPKHDVFLFDVNKGSTFTLWSYSLPDKTATPFGNVQSTNRTNAVFSPDGHWVAYQSRENGRGELFAQPFPSTGSTFPIHKSGMAISGPTAEFSNNLYPLWSPDGNELFYTSGPQQFAVIPITTQPNFAFGNPVPVPKGGSITGNPASNSPRNFDVALDGRIIGVVPDGQASSGSPAPPQIQVVLNWFSELRQRVPVK